jgi:integrase
MRAPAPLTCLDISAMNNICHSRRASPPAESPTRLSNSSPSSRHPYVTFQRTPDGPYWVRFSIPGEGQQRRKLSTRDPAEAERLAFEIYSEARYRAKQGLRSQAKTFQQVAAEFTSLLQREAERGDRRAHQVKQWCGIVDRYFVGFFADQAIDAIRDPDVARFWEWRREYWLTGPGKDIHLQTYMRNGRQIRKPITEAMRKPPSRSGQRSEAVVLRMLLRQAARWGYIKQTQLPEVEVPRVPANARPSFEAHEFTELDRVSQIRMADPKLNDHVRRDRAILHCWIMILAFTGMRPTEARNLNWSDVLNYQEGADRPIGERDIRLRVRGKGKSRIFVPMRAALPWFDLLWQLRNMAQGSPPEGTDPVFASLGGQRLSSVKKSLSELLRASELLTDHRGMRRTSYSFRHFYITQQIIAGVEVFLLAKNTGTSSAMIERFYADVKLERMTKELRPEWRGRGHTASMFSDSQKALLG